jgi:hypothetical protein
MSGDPYDNARLRNLRILCILVVGIAFAAVWASLPYLYVEHRRLEGWKMLGLWSSDFVALYWFARFVFPHAVFARPFASVAVSEGRVHFKSVILAGVTALVIDFAFTLFIMYDERTGYNQGLIAQGQIVDLQIQKRELATWYEFDCEFSDSSGVKHVAHLRVEAERHVLPLLPPGLIHALENPDPTTFPVRYDPRLPERVWVDGRGWENGHGIYWFSILTLAFQTPVLALFLILLAQSSKSGTMPWWWDVYKVLPLACEAFWLLAFGLIDRLLDLSG